MEAEIEALRLILDGLPKRGSRRIYTMELKRRVLEMVDRLTATGLNTKTACGHLGIHQGTVTDWRKGRIRGSVPKEKGRVVPVVLATPSARGLLTLVLPGGMRVEGLRLEDVVELARALR